MTSAPTPGHSWLSGLSVSGPSARRGARAHRSSQPDGPRPRQLTGRLGRQRYHPAGGNGDSKVSESNGTLVGQVTNDLGVGLVDTRWSRHRGWSPQALGAVGPGASSLVTWPLLRATVCRRRRCWPTARSAESPGGGKARGGAAEPVRPRGLVLQPGRRHPGARRLCQPPSLPDGPRHGGGAVGPADAVVVPLTAGSSSRGKAAELGPELVGSRGSPPAAADQPGTGSLALQRGGLALTTSSSSPRPVGSPRTELRLARRLGNELGDGAGAGGGAQTGTYAATTGSVVVSAFDYRPAGGSRSRRPRPPVELLAARHTQFATSGREAHCEVRLSSPSAALNVYGEVPVLSAQAQSTPSPQSTSSRAASRCQAADHQGRGPEEGLRQHGALIRSHVSRCPKERYSGSSAPMGPGRRRLSHPGRPDPAERGLGRGRWRGRGRAERDQLHELVGYMPDFFGVYDSMTAAEYLAFYASCYRLPKHMSNRVVADLLELVHLSAKARRPGRLPVPRHETTALPGPSARKRPQGPAPR